VWVSWARLGALADGARRARAYRVTVNCANSWWRRRMVKRRAIAGTRRIFTPIRTRQPNDLAQFPGSFAGQRTIAKSAG